MSRNDLKEIIARVVERLAEDTPKPACLYSDSSCDTCDGCDMTTRYAVGEEG